ncbi:putative lipoprotein [Ruegeria lacuscaerulensis ITI-1157]|nr:putative lipoprotein [Ruegeria lacuscaerulensis ITI-1157]SHJ20370.1 hypothetical protein SAMN05444404_1687 [Ruegeria lacuscaerulensis ITI-1157]
MQKTLSVFLIATLTLSGCSSWRDSRVNPSNWFGPGAPEPVAEPVDEANALIPDQGSGRGLLARPEQVDTSVPIATVTALRVDPRPSGAIVLATGTGFRQGVYDAQLLPVSSEENRKNGILEFEFRVKYPDYATAQGPERTREVTDAIDVSSQDLEGVRLIRVKGQQNALETRRR